MGKMCTGQRRDLIWGSRTYENVYGTKQVTDRCQVNLDKGEIPLGPQDQEDLT